VRSDGAGQADGGGAGVRIDNDFEAVRRAAEFHHVMSAGVARFECLQAGANGGLLEFAADFFGHSGRFGEIADGASGRGGEAGVGIEMQLDAYGVSGHWIPQD
jgi:hypothetical protein